MSAAPLAGVRVVTIALNLPGPVAAARLQELGADIVTVLPPSGDPVATLVRPSTRSCTAGSRCAPWT